MSNKNLKNWVRKNTNIINFYLNDAMLGVGFALIVASLFVIFAAIHNIDLSMNMLALLGTEKWWESEDIFSFSIVGNEIKYFSMPYPAIYIFSLQLLLVGIAVLIIGNIIFWTALSFMRSEAKKSIKQVIK